MFVAEVEVTSGSASRFWLGKLLHIACDIQHHVAGMETDFCIGVCGTLIQELTERLSCVDFCHRLGGCKCVKVSEERIIDDAFVEEEGNDDLLQSFYFIWW